MVLPVGRGVLAGGALVVLDVASAHGGARVYIFKPGEDVRGAAADGVGHHVEAAAMAHGKNDPGDAAGGRDFKGAVEVRDEDGQAFEREAFGAEVA